MTASQKWKPKQLHHPLLAHCSISHTILIVNIKYNFPKDMYFIHWSFSVLLISLVLGLQAHTVEGFDLVLLFSQLVIKDCLTARPVDIFDLAIVHVTSLDPVS